MANVLSREQQLTVLTLLVEGTSLRSITRITGVHRTTIAKLMVRTGDRLREFLDRRLRNLLLYHIECDEIWTFVLKKQGQLTPHEQDNPLIGDQYLFVGIDQETKLVASFALGKRTRQTTEVFINDLASRVVHRESFQIGHHPQISTDGWQSYPIAIENAFGSGASHVVLIKNYAEHEQPGRYGPPTLIGTERRVLSGTISRRSICTSHVERHNLSIRTFLRRFTRLALGFSKKLDNLCACVALYVAHYNFCRVHGSPNGTPAMEAGLTGHPWPLDELLREAEDA